MDEKYDYTLSTDGNWVLKYISFKINDQKDAKILDKSFKKLSKMEIFAHPTRKMLSVTVKFKIKKLPRHCFAELDAVFSVVNEYIKLV